MIFAFMTIVGLLLSLGPLFLGSWSSVLLMLGTYFFYPSWGLGVIDIEGVPLFAIILSLQAVFLLSRFALNGSIERLLPPYRILGAVAFFVLAFHFTLSPVIHNSILVNSVSGLSELVTFALIDFSGVVFFWALGLLLTNRQRMTQLYSFVGFMGAVLATEYFLVKFVLCETEIVYRYTFGTLDRFESIFLNDNLTVTIWLSVSSLVFLYRFIQGRSLVYLGLAMILCYPLILSVQRKVFLALLLSGGVLFVFQVGAKKSLKYIGVGLVLGLVLLSGVNFGSVARMTDSKMLANKMSNIFSYQSLFARFGIQVRSAEVIGHLFPLGTGPNMDKYFMAKSPPDHLEGAFFNKMPEEFKKTYWRVSEYDSLKKTNSHNLYMSLVLNHGVFGVFFLFTSICLVAASSATYSRSWLRGEKLDVDMSLSVSIMIFFFVMYFFLSRPIVYPLALIPFSLLINYKYNSMEKTS